MNERIPVLNGPSLDLPGGRGPGIYGHTTLADVERRYGEEGERLGLNVTFRQSNGEAEPIGRVEDVPGHFEGRVIKSGAYRQTSVALLDAGRSIDVPLIEVHLSNIYQRETFRQHSYVSLAARGVICGLGPTGYLLALRALAELLHHD